MDAADITAALGGRWHGSYGTARCPAHEDRNPSLSVSDGEDGRVLFHCHAGCPQEAVADTLRGRGLFGGDTSDRDHQPKPKPRPGRCQRDDDRSKLPREIFKTGAPAAGTPVEAYLRGRGIDIEIPPSVRYVQACKYTPSGIWLPAMVAGVQAPDRRITAIHRTYLDPAGKGKAQVSSAKMALGPLGAGAVRLAAAGDELGLAEGIETGLSAMQLFDVPVWCALGSRLDAVDVPDIVRHVIIFADTGDAGHEAAEKAADRHTAAGRRVTIRRPPEGDSDFNDTLRGQHG